MSPAMVEFFGEIDILLLAGGKSAVKVSEAIDARIVVPIGEDREEFLATVGQEIMPVDRYKPREADLESETTIFVYLA